MLPLSEDVAGKRSPTEASTCVKNIDLELSTSAEKDQYRINNLRHIVVAFGACIVREALLNWLLVRCDEHENEKTKQQQRLRHCLYLNLNSYK